MLKVRVRGMKTLEAANRFARAMYELATVERVDCNTEKQLARICARTLLTFAVVAEQAKSHGFVIEAVAPSAQSASGAADNPQIMHLAISGMHCRSCEITIERKWKAIPGVHKVDVDAARGSARIICAEDLRPEIAALQSVVASDGYTVRHAADQTDTSSATRRVILNERRASEGPLKISPRPSFWRLLSFFVLAYIVLRLLARAGFLHGATTIGASVSFTAAFIIGLVAASSSCIAVSGGLLLASAQSFHDRYGGRTTRERMAPVFLFVVGRLAAYGILGAMIGAIGKAFAPSPFVTGVITVMAAVYMLIMGLDMLQLAPGWMKRFLPRVPKSLSHTVMDQEKRKGWFAPVMLGALTFFLPCGFTQALQLYALTTGSALAGGTLLFAFALGTAPALVALGLASGSLKGRAGRFFFRFAGALVILLGFWNIQNGFTVAGYPLGLPKISLRPAADAAASSGDGVVTFDGQIQRVAIAVSYAGYSPNNFTVRRGVPVELDVNGNGAGGCLSGFQIPQFGIRTLLKQGEITKVAFTPQDVGTFTFSCSMGMYRGQFVVTDS